MAQAIAENRVLPKLVEHAHSLFSLPAIAVDVLDLTEQPKVDVEALKACIERDPALTSKILRVVNSSLFGLSRKVSDLKQALALLGVKPLKLLVLGFSLPSSLFVGVQAEVLKRYWRFTLIKATAARELSRVCWSLSGDEAFIAGLLQEIGSLVLIQQLGSSYSEFLVATNRSGKNLCQLEIETLGFDHTILSARLLEHWKLPPSIVDAVSLPHNLDALANLPEETASLPQILHLASLIAAIIVDDRRDLTSELLEAGQQYRHITAEQFHDRLDEIQHRVDLLADLFSVRMDDQETYREILIRAHQQMSDATHDILPQIIAGTGDGVLAEHQHKLGLAAEQLEVNGPSPATRQLPNSPVGGQVAKGREQLYQPVQRIESTEDSRFLGHVNTALSQGRLDHFDVSLMLLEVNDFSQLLIQVGPERLSRLIDSLEVGIRHFCESDVDCLLVTDSRWAVMMLDCECRQAVGYARQLVERLPKWLIENGRTDTTLDLRAGIATVGFPSRRFSPQQVAESAERCLFAAQSSGVQAVKSLDLV